MIESICWPARGGSSCKMLIDLSLLVNGLCQGWPNYSPGGQLRPSSLQYRCNTSLTGLSSVSLNSLPLDCWFSDLKHGHTILKQVKSCNGPWQLRFISMWPTNTKVRPPLLYINHCVFFSMLVRWVKHVF